MAINNAIRLLASVLLVALVAPALSAQGMSDQTNGGGQEGIGGAATPPATLAENPPKAPKVTCDGDQLTISANNSTLGSVLAAVHACIGIQIDIPAGAGGGRTFEQLGPGPERQVLESLLSGTDFNYVIGSSDEDPGKVETVLLMERTTEVAANAPPSDRSLSPARRLWLGPRRMPGAPIHPATTAPSPRMKRPKHRPWTNLLLNRRQPRTSMQFRRRFRQARRPLRRPTHLQLRPLFLKAPL